MRLFLGLASYYRKFVEKFSAIATPLTALLHKDHKFEWSKEAQKAFDMLKEKLTTTPVLLLPDPTKPFVITTDASDYAIGAVLLQIQGKVNNLSHMNQGNCHQLNKIMRYMKRNSWQLYMPFVLGGCTWKNNALLW